MRFAGCIVGERRYRTDICTGSGPAVRGRDPLVGATRSMGSADVCSGMGAAEFMCRQTDKGRVKPGGARSPIRGVYRVACPRGYEFAGHGDQPELIEGQSGSGAEGAEDAKRGLIFL